MQRGERDRGAGTAAVQAMVRKAIAVRGFVDYYQMPSYARGLDEAIDSLEQILKDGQAFAAIELCESAIALLARHMESMDDSDGRTSTPLRTAEPIRQIFWRGSVVCGDSRPGVLEGVPAVGGGGMGEGAGTDRGKPRQRMGTHFKVTEIMKSLARLSGDLDRLVAVMSRDLTHS